MAKPLLALIRNFSQKLVKQATAIKRYAVRGQRNQPFKNLQN